MAKAKKETSTARKALLSAVGRYAGITKQPQGLVYKELYRRFWQEQGLDLRIITPVRKNESLIDKAERCGYIHILLDIAYALLAEDKQQRAEKREQERIKNQLNQDTL